MIKFYQIIWFISLLILYAVYVLFNKVYNISLDGTIVVHMILTVIMFQILSTKKINSLMKYLKTNHFDKWEYLNSYPVFGLGLINIPKILKFIKSNEDFSDSNLKKLKGEYLNFYRFIFIALFSYFISIFLNVI